MTTSLTVPETAVGTRLDAFVAASMGMSRAKAAGLVEAGLVHVNGAGQRKSHRLEAGDVVVVEEPPVRMPVPPEGVEVIHEDDEMMVVYKPAGVVVHPAPGLREGEGTLVDALAKGGRQLARRAGEDRPGIVHRLDREVSGLLVVAKTDRAHAELSRSLQQRAIERIYVALVHGTVASDRGKIDAPLGRHPRHRTRMAVLPEGRPAVTWFSVNERLADYTLLEVRLETGRTHQIRAHLSSIGHPVVGDEAYGSRERGRPFLHAHRLELTHPVTGERLTFTSELPAELARALSDLRGSRSPE